VYQKDKGSSVTQTWAKPNLEHGSWKQLATNSDVLCTNADPVIKTRDRKLGQEGIRETTFARTGLRPVVNLTLDLKITTIPPVTVCTGSHRSEVCVVQVGVLCPERSRFTHSGENVSGLAGEAIMLCMEPLCVRMMQLAFFTLSFT
jgi:hypothetical protein